MGKKYYRLGTHHMKGPVKNIGEGSVLETIVIDKR